MQQHIICKKKTTGNLVTAAKILYPYDKIRADRQTDGVSLGIGYGTLKRKNKTYLLYVIYIYLSIYIILLECHDKPSELPASTSSYDLYNGAFSPSSGRTSSAASFGEWSPPNGCQNGYRLLWSIIHSDFFLLPLL